MRLTVRGIEALEPGEKRREIPDSLMTGLYLLVQPGTGNKVWAVRCRQNGRPRKFTIGRYPLYGLAEAREAAQRILRSVSEGRDPGRLNTGSVDATIAQFLERYARRKYRPSTLREVSRTLDRALAAWRGRRLDSIAKADVRDLLDSIGAPAASNAALKFLKRLFSWAVAEDLLKASPLIGFQKPHAEKSRERILTEDELGKVWKAADAAGYAFGDFVKVAILTGQRPGEVSGMRREELHGDTWILPGERVKNKKSHSVPLSRQALAIIEAAPQISTDHVFSYAEGKPIRGLHHAKQALDKAAGVTGWTLHDLRRTCASGLELGGTFAPLLAHTSRSEAWQRLSVGARALFMELQSRYYQDREGYVFLSARDGGERLRTRPHNILRWFDELVHYGFLVMLCDHHLGVDGEGQSAHYRLTDRWFHGEAPTRDFDKWSGEIFTPRKRVYSAAEKARLNGLKKQNPVTRPDTPRDTVGHISAGAKRALKGGKCDTAGHISEPPRCDTVDHISSIATGSCSLEAWLGYAVQPMTVEMLDAALSPSNQRAA